MTILFLFKIFEFVCVHSNIYYLGLWYANLSLISIDKGFRHFIITTKSSNSTLTLSMYRENLIRGHNTQFVSYIPTILLGRKHGLTSFFSDKITWFDCVLIYLQFS
jgi:hypothetical protein